MLNIMQAMCKPLLCYDNFLPNGKGNNAGYLEGGSLNKKHKKIWKYLCKKVCIVAARSGLFFGPNRMALSPFSRANSFRAERSLRFFHPVLVSGSLLQVLHPLQDLKKQVTQCPFCSHSFPQNILRSQFSTKRTTLGLRPL